MSKITSDFIKSIKKMYGEVGAVLAGCPRFAVLWLTWVRAATLSPTLAPKTKVWRERGTPSRESAGRKSRFLRTPSLALRAARNDKVVRARAPRKGFVLWTIRTGSFCCEFPEGPLLGVHRHGVLRLQRNFARRNSFFAQDDSFVIGGGQGLP